MVDSQGVAVLYSIQELKEDPLGQDVVAYEVTMFGNVCEEITFWAVFDNDISTVNIRNDLDKVDNIWMCASTVMQGDFPFLEPALSRIEPNSG